MRRFQLPSPRGARGRLWARNRTPDPEGPSEPAEFQQLATLYASSCPPMLDFAGCYAGLCRALLAQLSKFVDPAPICVHSVRLASALSCNLQVTFCVALVEPVALPIAARRCLM